MNNLMLFSVRSSTVNYFPKNLIPIFINMFM